MFTLFCAVKGVGGKKRKKRQFNSMLMLVLTYQLFFSIWALPLILPIQQPPVFGDLQLQASLEVQQHVVLLLVASNVSVQLRQLSLQACHHVLQRDELGRIAGLGLRQSALQRCFLLREV